MDSRGHRRDLERQHRGQLAAFDLDVKRCTEPLEQLDARTHPRGRAPERHGDRRRIVAAVEEQAHETRLLERAHAPARGIEDEAKPRRGAVVELEYERRDLAPAKRIDRLVAQEPVDEFEDTVRQRPHDERTAQTDRMDARHELRDARRVGEDGCRGRHDAPDLHRRDDAHDPSPSRARIAATDTA